jgi:hypothetical protein
MKVGDAELDYDVEKEKKLERRKSRGSLGSVSTFGSGSASGSMGYNGGMGIMEEDRKIPLPQQPREVQVKGMRTCRECWAVIS